MGYIYARLRGRNTLLNPKPTKIMSREQVTRNIPSNDALISEISKRQAKLLESFLAEVECKRRFNLRFLQKVRGTKGVTERITFLQPATATPRDFMRIQIQTSPEECLEYSVVEIKGVHNGTDLYSFFIKANVGLNVWPAPKPSKEETVVSEEAPRPDGQIRSFTKFRKALLNGDDKASQCIAELKKLHGEPRIPVTVTELRDASKKVLGVEMSRDSDYERIIGILAEPSRGFLTRANGLFYIAGEAPFEEAEAEEVQVATEDLLDEYPDVIRAIEEAPLTGTVQLPEGARSRLDETRRKALAERRAIEEGSQKPDEKVDPIDALLESLEGKQAKQQRRLADLKVCERDRTLAEKTKTELEEELERLQTRLEETKNLLSEIDKRKARLEEEGKEFEADNKKLARLKKLLEGVVV